MAKPTAATARDFVGKLELPAPPPPRPAAARALAPFNFEAAKDQAIVVGSDIVSFVKTVTPQQRRDIVNALLLAQLVAKKAVPEPGTLDQIRAWYERYFDVLSNIGFAIQEKDLRKYNQKGDGFEVHEAILEVAAVLLGPGSTALAVLTATLKALQKAGGNQPWITLFNKESQFANAARFQVSTVDGDANGALVFLSSFALEATANLTQVLFFKFRSNDVTIEHSSGKVSIDAQVLAAVREEIAAKLIKHTSEYVAGLPDL